MVVVVVVTEVEEGKEAQEQRKDQSPVRKRGKRKNHQEAAVCQALPFLSSDHCPPSATRSAQRGTTHWRFMIEAIAIKAETCLRLPDICLPSPQCPQAPGLPCLLPCPPPPPADHSLEAFILKPAQGSGDPFFVLFFQSLSTGLGKAPSPHGPVDAHLAWFSS